MTEEQYDESTTRLDDADLHMNRLDVEAGLRHKLQRYNDKYVLPKPEVQAAQAQLEKSILRFYMLCEGAPPVVTERLDSVRLSGIEGMPVGNTLVSFDGSCVVVNVSGMSENEKPGWLELGFARASELFGTERDPVDFVEIPYHALCINKAGLSGTDQFPERGLFGRNQAARRAISLMETSTSRNNLIADFFQQVLETAMNDDTYEKVLATIAAPGTIEHDLYFVPVDEKEQPVFSKSVQPENMGDGTYRIKYMARQMNYDGDCIGTRTNTHVDKWVDGHVNDSCHICRMVVLSKELISLLEMISPVQAAAIEARIGGIDVTDEMKRDGLHCLRGKEFVNVTDKTVESNRNQLIELFRPEPIKVPSEASDYEKGIIAALNEWFGSEEFDDLYRNDILNLRESNDRERADRNIHLDVLIRYFHLYVHYRKTAETIKQRLEETPESIKELDRIVDSLRCRIDALQKAPYSEDSDVMTARSQQHIEMSDSLKKAYDERDELITFREKYKDWNIDRMVPPELKKAHINAERCFQLVHKEVLRKMRTTIRVKAQELARDWQSV